MPPQAVCGTEIFCQTKMLPLFAALTSALVLTAPPAPVVKPGEEQASGSDLTLVVKLESGLSDGVSVYRIVGDREVLDSFIDGNERSTHHMSFEDYFVFREFVPKADLKVSECWFDGVHIDGFGTRAGKQRRQALGYQIERRRCGRKWSSLSISNRFHQPKCERCLFCSNSVLESADGL